MSRGLTLLFAIAGGTAVANLYWAQPLLEFVGRDLHTSTALAGWLVTVTQIGYAAGALLLVPLGDVLDRRRFIPGLMLCAALALVACALAPSIGAFLVATTLLGLTTVSGQLLTPLAGDLADDTGRGQVVGTVVSGLLIGILTSRTISGLIADAAGWRAIYFAAAAVSVVFALLLRRAIPPLAPKARLSYPQLLLSVWKVIRQERAVRWTLFLGATAFGVFTMFWTALTFLLSARPFSYSVSVIGLFGLIGLSGALAAQRGGAPPRPGLVPAGDRMGLGRDRGLVRRRALRRPFRSGGHRGRRAARHRRAGRQHPQPDTAVRALVARPKSPQHGFRHLQLHWRRDRFRRRLRAVVRRRLDRRLPDRRRARLRCTPRVGPRPPRTASQRGKRLNDRPKFLSVL
ncbi:MFS transporter [Streptomyces sp. NPDC001652]|uniref:MFS transporter n=1 Tax=Streptomyces sp. NPDC001652 TaxID=3154393 RepID=UPI003330A790